MSADDAVRNRELWTRMNAEYTDRAAVSQWEQEEITWGVWGVPERELRVLPEVGALDCLELGCGTAYFSAWLARRGARVVGLDLTPAQLKYAASDVLHLHALRAKLDEMLAREGRKELAESCFRFLPTRAELDLAGWVEDDIFAH